ncbi:MAG: hypothetical protein HN828_05180 [Candidatus Thioglobus sp.]|nr:hypothetical protein [Candidatus Thioglobus sp.]MBT3432002.1 hypothetical protein [Candidatus Thioglobus sp.]MBT4315684.1 hypothetical protein [Candidatus Thioglobus sp.]MBT4553850.1 hypothetical protein [Candidatus Thioglobus sp.]MBT5286592.1 hypothetical protein [Candidatus Thioglobus sp.]
MTIAMWQSFFGWSLLINWSVLIVWILVIKLAPDFVYRVHSYWLPISRASFNAIHYGGIGLYKLFIFFFLMTPYFVLMIIK